jgi:hypothetical protein
MRRRSRGVVLVRVLGLALTGASAPGLPVASGLGGAGACLWWWMPVGIRFAVARLEVASQSRDAVRFQGLGKVE